jgi:hypothetical protein
MWIIETLGGIWLSMSGIAFLLVAALDRPLQTWLKAETRGAGQPERAAMAFSEPTPADTRQRDQVGEAMPVASGAARHRRRNPQRLKEAA